MQINPHPITQNVLCMKKEDKNKRFVTKRARWQHIDN